MNIIPPINFQGGETNINKMKNNDKANRRDKGL